MIQKALPALLLMAAAAPVIAQGGSIVDRYRPDQGPTPVTDEPYEIYDAESEGEDLTPRMNTRGEGLVRHVMQHGSLRSSIYEMFNEHDWTVVWSGIPDCLDWFVASPYVVQAPNLTELASASLGGYPLRASLHIPNKVASITPIGHFTETCK